MTYARLALACGEPCLRRLLRSVTARELTFWQAYEEVEGPIGYGPIVKLAAWLGWTQCDGSKVSAGNVLEIIEAFLADPHDDDDREHEDDEILSDEDLKQRRAEQLAQKVMRMFGHPELAEDD